MSCEKVVDIQDIVGELFEFDDEPNRPVKQKKVKKQHTKKKPVVNQLLTKDNEEGEADQVDFSTAQIQGNENVVPGTQKIFVKTFGCSHNISDSEFMIGQLVEFGYTIVDSIDNCDLVLINSCTVKNPSQDAFMTMVVNAKKIKKPLVVAGCVPQGDRNINQIVEISSLGVTQIDRVVEVVQQTLKGNKVQLMQKKGLPSLDLPKIRKNKEIQIIPINSGCLGSCTYCKTVFARGQLGSYSPEAIAKRVSNVVEQGVKEIWLTSQDTGAYGRDINTNISQLLVTLSKQLEQHGGIMLRIGMTNPPYILDHLPTIAKFLNHPRVFSFMHIPVQSGNNKVLEEMNRQYTVEEFCRVCDYLIEHVPDITIATDIICGFPGETNQQFEDTLSLMKKYKFPVTNISQFYPRPGTAAAKMQRVPTNIVKERSTACTKVFQSFDKFTHMKDKTYRVWINQKQNIKGTKCLVGHTKGYVKVVIPYEDDLLHTQINFKVTKIFDWHVEGQIVQKGLKPVDVPEGYFQHLKSNVQQQNLKLKQKREKVLAERLERKIKQQQQYNQKSQPVIKEESKPDSLPKEAKIKTKYEEDVQAQKEKVLNRNQQIPKPQVSYIQLYLAVALFIIGGIMYKMGY